MSTFIDPVLDGIDTLLAWIGSGVKATIDANCEIQTADSKTALVANDGSLVSVLKIEGVSHLIGDEEFRKIHGLLMNIFSPIMSSPGHMMQVVFSYNPENTNEEIEKNYSPARETVKALSLDLEDLLNERVRHIGKFCSSESTYLVIWTKINSLTKEQLSNAMKKKAKLFSGKNMPVFRYTQNVYAAIPDLRVSHDSAVRSVINNSKNIGVVLKVLEVHEALKAVRMEVDKPFTSDDWNPILPGDKIRPKVAKSFTGDIADICWPSISRQIFPRDAVNIEADTTELGDYIYGAVFIDLFPLEIQSFNWLLSRTIHSKIPWRISFLLESDALSSVRLKKALSTILAFSSGQNRLIADGIEMLEYIELNTDDSAVSLRVAACTWAPKNDKELLKVRVSILARAIQGWGSCDVSQICGDPFEGYLSTIPAVSSSSVATSTVASFSDSLYMLPFFRPTSPWANGALLFRSPDGKLWPYQPGSPLQSTSIDLMYARPGSGKSVLSNALNLALCLKGGLTRLPMISIIDIGPSSSGLISLLQEALPIEKRNQAAYFRLQMSEEYSINPFDTQLGCRYPSPSDRSFLVNFITLLATPISEDSPSEGMPDMVGLIVDEAYRAVSDENSPHIYTSTTNEDIDAIIKDMGFVADEKTSWWEVTDALFIAGFKKEAILAQRYAMPLVGDLAATCRTPAVEDLYGKIVTPTGELLIAAFTRMISSAIREYPILSRYTQFDIGEARVASIDLDEVAKTGGAAADRQTAVMYMLARYVLTRDFYLNVDSLGKVPEIYLPYHKQRVSEAQEDPKRLVLDEFHRTSRSESVRMQIIEDMREGRKWRIQVALISQSIDDFDSVMVDFATSTFILDSGPEQAIKKTTQTFGLSPSAVSALRQSVRGPSEVGATMLGQFATKYGTTTQLITLTLGPIELWAFSTTSGDYLVRNKLYKRIGPVEARKVLSRVFPSGSAASFIAARARNVKNSGKVVDDAVKSGLLNDLVEEIITEYRKNPDFKVLPKY